MGIRGIKGPTRATRSSKAAESFWDTNGLEYCIRSSRVRITSQKHEFSKNACRETFPKKGGSKNSQEIRGIIGQGSRLHFPRSSQHLQSMFHSPKQPKIIWFAGEVQAIHRSMMFLHLLTKYQFLGTLLNQIHLAPNYELGRVHLNAWFWIKMVVSIWRFDSNSVRHTEDDPNTWNPQDDLMTSARPVSFLSFPNLEMPNQGPKFTISSHIATPKRSFKKLLQADFSELQHLLLQLLMFFFSTFALATFPVDPSGEKPQGQGDWHCGIPSSTSWLLQLTMVVWVESLGDMCRVGSIH